MYPLHMVHRTLWCVLWKLNLGIFFRFCFCSDSILRHASSDFKKMGKRIFVFIVGGATRSEVSGTYLHFCFWRTALSVHLIYFFEPYGSLQMRTCYKLSTKLNREIILGSSSIDDPPQFITVNHTDPC